MKGTDAGGVQSIFQGQALEALCAWSDNLKSFQQRIGKYFAFLKPKEQPLTIFKQACVQWKMGAWQNRWVHQSTRLQHLLRRYGMKRQGVCRGENYVVSIWMMGQGF